MSTPVWKDAPSDPTALPEPIWAPPPRTPHATPCHPTPVSPHPHHHPFPGAAHLPGPNPHASTRGGHKWPAGRQRQGAGWLPGNSPQVEGESGSKATPALESPEALSKPTPVDSPPKEAEGGQGRSPLAGQQTCQGHGRGAVRVPDEERETGRQGGWVGLAGDCCWPWSPAPGPGRGRPSWKAVWLAGGLEGLVRPTVRLSVRPSFRTRTPEGEGAWGRAGVQERRPVLQQQQVLGALQRQHASVYGHTTLNAPDLV